MKGNVAMFAVSRGSVCLAGALVMLAAGGLRAEVSLPAIFSDNMVLQQGKPAPVYGTAAPAEKVTVAICGQRKQATADAAGDWKVMLEPLTWQSEPTEMRVTRTNAITIRNVLVGDVWLASGQSNMAMRVSGVYNAPEEIKAANYPEIRFFMVGRDLASAPRKDTAGEWLICTPENVKGFSAVAYFFARDIHASYGIPVGVINSAVGASSCEAWTPVEVLLADRALPQPAAIPPEEYPDWKTYDAVRKRIYEAAAHKDPGIKPECLQWTAPDYDASAWKDVTVPGSIESRGMNIDGAVWFRTEVDLPADWARKDANLYLGPITQNSVAFVNGTEVGRRNNAVAVQIAHSRQLVRRWFSDERLNHPHVRRVDNTIAVHVGEQSWRVKRE